MRVNCSSSRPGLDTRCCSSSSSSRNQQASPFFSSALLLTHALHTPSPTRPAHNTSHSTHYANARHDDNEGGGAHDGQENGPTKQEIYHHWCRPGWFASRHPTRPRNRRPPGKPCCALKGWHHILEDRAAGVLSLRSSLDSPKRDSSSNMARPSLPPSSLTHTLPTPHKNR